MEVGEAFSLISRAVDADSAANGYLVVGDVRGNCAELLDRLLQRIFPGEEEKIRSHCHPDVVVLGPEGKSRKIHLESVQEGLVAPMSVTAYSGGWKVGVLEGADRMEVQAANAFLKTLEEPTPKTMYFLLTDSPDAVLPTIVSRCQRIDLKLTSGLLEGAAYDAVAEVMNGNVGAGVYQHAMAAQRLAEILSGVKESVEDADVAIVRRRFYRTVLSFARQWMIAGSVPRHVAFRNIEAVEEAVGRSERYISDDAVISQMVDLMVFPGKGAK